MGFILPKKISLLFLLISAALLSTSFAGRRVYKSVALKEVSTTHEDIESWEPLRHDEVSEVHERLLKVQTNDYGRYDPAPALKKGHNLFRSLPPAYFSLYAYTNRFVSGERVRFDHVTYVLLMSFTFFFLRSLM
ncbi:hypothetical protein Pfo_002807 [Paulownia fortunei]|nr:hypothetical protein Pfo_002807 [Paulownia fortunei]